MDLNSSIAEDSDLSEPSSPLKSMSMTTDTLALRQSHIGNNYPNSYLMVNEYQKSIGGTNHGHVKEFVPYPPDIISTTVERSSATNWGYQSNKAIVSQNHLNRSNRSKNDKTKVNRMSSQESIITVDNSQDYNEIDKQSVVSVRSLRSRYDSNDSITDNLSAINYFESHKELRSVETQHSVDMINEYVQVSIIDHSTGPLFELKRSNANMKGKLEQLDYIVEEMVRERSNLQMNIHSLEKELKVRNDRNDELNNQRESLLLESDELKSGITKWESIVSEYQEVVEAKSLEIQALNDDILKITSDNENIKINCEHLKIDLESKENLIKELNRKLIQISGELDSLIKNKVGLEDELKKIKGDMNSISQQKDWCESEHNKLQMRLNETHQKLVSEQEISINARNEWQKAQALNAVLKQQLIEVKHKAVKEKEQLMRHLEGIGADLIQKEAEHQLMSPKINQNILNSIPEKVPQNFDQKMNDKTLEIESLKRELKSLSEINQKIVKEQELVSNDLNNYKKSLNDKEYEINTLKSYNSDLEFKIRGLNIDLKRQKELSEMLRKDKKESESKLTSLSYDNKALENSTKQSKEIIEKYERSLKQLKSNIIAKESKIDLLEKEKLKFSNQISSRDEEIDKLKNISNSVPNDPTELTEFELKIQNSELEKIVNALNTEMRASQIKFDKQKNEIMENFCELESKLNEEKMKFKKLKDDKDIESNQINELRAETNFYKNKSSELENELHLSKINKNINDSNYGIKSDSEIIKVKDEKIRSLESNVKLLTKKYREMVQNKKELEDKVLDLAQNPIRVVQSYASTQTEVNSSSGEDVIKDNEKEIQNLREMIKTKESIIDSNEKIILKLEHEKGKLSSAGENSMNQHIMSLEILVSSKSEELTDLNEKLRQSNKNLKELEFKLNKKLSELENDLKKEKAIVKDLRHSIFAEKRENSYHKKDLNELKKAMTESNAIADKRKQELIDIENEFKIQKELEISLRNDIETTKHELKITKEDNSRLRMKIDDSLNKNEPLLEQLKNLSLNLMEKNQEIEGIKSNSNAIKERYETELQCLKQQTDSYRSDSESLNEELNALRKEKFNLQSRLAELRVVLKNSYEQNKKLKEQLNSFKACEVISQESAYNEELVAKLLDQSYENTKEIRPLVNLQTCVESLKLEMELLQKQISEHSN